MWWRHYYSTLWWCRCLIVVLSRVMCARWLSTIKCWGDVSDFTLDKFIILVIASINYRSRIIGDQGRLMLDGWFQLEQWYYRICGRLARLRYLRCICYRSFPTKELVLVIHYWTFEFLLNLDLIVGQFFLHEVINEFWSAWYSATTFFKCRCWYIARLRLPSSVIWQNSSIITFFRIRHLFKFMMILSKEFKCLHHLRIHFFQLLLNLTLRPWYWLTDLARPWRPPFLLALRFVDSSRFRLTDVTPPVSRHSSVIMLLCILYFILVQLHWTILRLNILNEFTYYKLYFNGQKGHKTHSQGKFINYWLNN